MTDQNPTVEEQREMLEAADKTTAPEPPPYLVMEDEQPERFNKMMDEGKPEGGGDAGMSGVVSAINGLPDKILERLKDD